MPSPKRASGKPWTIGRSELQSIASNLDSNGVNMDVVYVVDVIRQSLSRITAIAAVLGCEPGPAKMTAAKHLLTDMVRGRLDDRSLRHLAHNNLRLLARKITDWAGKTGEHYITTDRSEYLHMWKAAMGGGLLTVGTAAIKMVVTHSDLPLFAIGFFSGLNYAVSFVLLQVFGLVLATKQPSMTGAALARIVRDCKDVSRSDELITFVARIFRSQLAAALGNIVAASIGAVAFSYAWRAVVGAPFLSEATCATDRRVPEPFPQWHHLVRRVDRRHPVALQPGGRMDRKLGRQQSPSAGYRRTPLKHHAEATNAYPHLRRLHPQHFGWGGSIALGFMLGMTPPLASFFGLPIDVRHVTLSTGTVALSAGSLGRESFANGDLYWAVLGIAFTFVLNLSVSFYFALMLALRAHDVSRKDHLQIVRSLWRRFLQSPRDFFLPPPTEAGVVATTH